MLCKGLFEDPEQLHLDGVVQRLKILDVGPARSNTVRFFNQIRCRLYFADLFAEQMQYAEIVTDDNTTENLFPTLESYPKGELFDLCFFWDFLNYLDTPKLQAFNLALQPFIHNGTKAHAFTTQNTRTAIQDLSYGIEDQDRLSEHPRDPLPLDLHNHSLADIKDHFPCLNTTRSRLLTDGRIEIFMSAHGS